jgi:hypothetical protein
VLRADSLPLCDADARDFVLHTTLASLSGLAITVVSISLLPGWRGATLGAGQGLLWCAWMLRRRRTAWMGNLVLFGVVAGLVELLADLWLVRGTGTLVYPRGGPFLLESPAYMPVAWFGMLSTGMAIGLALRRRYSVAVSSALVAVALGLYIPLFESFAGLAGWWHYRACAMALGGVPVYIVLGEVLIAVPLVALTERMRRAGPGTAAALGVAQGLWIFAAYALAYAVSPAVR